MYGFSLFKVSYGILNFKHCNYRLRDIAGGQGLVLCVCGVDGAVVVVVVVVVAVVGWVFHAVVPAKSVFKDMYNLTKSSNLTF